LSRTAYDGVNTDAATIKKIIEPGDVVLYYIDGLYAWSAAEIALFPHNLHVTITVLGGNADVADCETGDLTPEQAAAWVIKRKAAGYDRPTIYRSLAGMPDIRKATGSLIMGKDWDAFVADYDRVPTQVYPGAVAKQYRSTAGYDVSEIYDDAWPHRTKTPVIIVPPAPPIITTVKPKWPAGLTLILGNKGNAVEALQTALSDSGITGVRGIVKDGVFGQQTRTAIRNFEVAENLALDPDGLALAGPQVRGKLINLGLLTAAGQPIN
jgi:hypothetical protein